MEALVTSLQGRVPDTSAWTNRRVLVTGHTGFKGAWLTRWLARLGAEVHGLALDPPTAPALFEMADVEQILASDRRIDLRDAAAVETAVRAVAPSVVLHLAAQPLVRDSYRDPSATFGTNVQGTVHLLSALRGLSTLDATIIVTTDKVYAPLLRPHDEEDTLGGHDPYAWSKVMVEQTVAAFRSVPELDGAPAWTTPIATARAGNVIGGGDWAFERLVPDCIRSFNAGRSVRLRFPSAIRPWQHVLEPLRGYLLLAESLLGEEAHNHSRPYNFGPKPENHATTLEVASALAARWGCGAAVDPTTDQDQPAEDSILQLRSDRARESLDWTPSWDLETTLDRTLDAYRDLLDGGGAQTLDAQIDAYVKDSVAQGGSHS